MPCLSTRICSVRELLGHTEAQTLMRATYRLNQMGNALRRPVDLISPRIAMESQPGESTDRRAALAGMRRYW